MGLVVVNKLRVLRSNGDALGINRLLVLSSVVSLRSRALRCESFFLCLGRLPRGAASTFWLRLGHCLSGDLAQTLIVIIIIGVRGGRAPSLGR